MINMARLCLIQIILNAMLNVSIIWKYNHHGKKLITTLEKKTFPAFGKHVQMALQNNIQLQNKYKKIDN